VFSIFWSVLLAISLGLVPAAAAEEETSQKTLDRIFLQAINDINANQFADASGKFTQLQKTAAQSGWESLPSFSVALIERAEAMLATGEREKAAFLLRRAEELSPRDPKVLFALSRFPELHGYGASIGYGFQALRNSYSSPLVLGIFLVNLFLVGLVALTLSLGLVCVVQFVRSTEAVFTRVSKVVPQYCRGVVTGPLVLVLMLLPAFGGILLAIVCWSALLSRSVPACRRLALAAGIVTAAWGLSLPLAAALLGSLGSRPAQVVSELALMSYSPDSQELIAPSTPLPSVPLMLFARAQSLYLNGRLEEAKSEFRKIATKGDTALAAVIEANSAAVSLALQDVAAAKADLLQHEATEGPTFETSYNLALVSLAELDTESQRKYYEQARSIDAGRLARLESLTEGRALALLSPPPTKMFLPFLLHPFEQPRGSSRGARENSVASALIFGAGPTFLVVLGICVSVFGLMRPKTDDAPAGEPVPIGALWKVLPGGRALCGDRPAGGACVLALFLGFLLAGSGVPVHLVPVAAVTRDSSNVFFVCAVLLAVFTQLLAVIVSKLQARRGGL